MKDFRQLCADIIAGAFVMLFVYAALSKLLDGENFRIQLSQSVLLSKWSRIAWWGVPAAEFSVALALVIPHTRLAGLYGAFGVMVLFTGYIIAVTRFSPHVPCSCGGVLASMSWNVHLIFNIAFLLAGAAAILIYPFRRERSGELKNVMTGSGKQTSRMQRY